MTDRQRALLRVGREFNSFGGTAEMDRLVLQFKGGSPPNSNGNWDVYLAFGRFCAMTIIIKMFCEMAFELFPDCPRPR